MDAFQENKLARVMAEELRERAYQKTNEALRLARLCKAPKAPKEGEAVVELPPPPKEQAKLAGQLAAEARKAAKEAEAKAASARRIACFLAMQKENKK